VPIKNVSVSIQSIAEGLNISKTYANKRLQALSDVGLIFRVKAEDSFNGNKNTQPAIYMLGEDVIDNSYDYEPPTKNSTKELSIAVAGFNINSESSDDGVPF
jgi:DNA-binding Lrp family transcriptional regulator